MRPHSAQECAKAHSVLCTQAHEEIAALLHALGAGILQAKFYNNG